MSGLSRAKSLLGAPRVPAKTWAVRFLSDPVARLLVALHISANMITLAGLAVAGVAGWLLSEGLVWQGGLVMLAGSMMDMFDGAVARRTGQASTFGAFLDSVTARLGEAVVLFGLLVFYVRDAHTLGAYLAFGAIVTSTMVSYTRARAEGLGIEGDVGIMGRPERIVVLAAGLLVVAAAADAPLYALGVITAGAGFTVLQRTHYVWRKTRV